MAYAWRTVLNQMGKWTGHMRTRAGEPRAAVTSQGQSGRAAPRASATVTCCSAILCGPACAAGLVKWQHAGECVRLLEAEAKDQRHVIRRVLRVGQSPQRLDH